VGRTGRDAPDSAGFYRADLGSHAEDNGSLYDHAELLVSVLMLGQLCAWFDLDDR
jgi:hypothetical protein